MCEGLQFVQCNVLDFHAEGFLLCQVVFLFGFAGFKVGLVFLADDGAGFLEAVPQFFADFLCHGASLLPFLVQTLQLVDGGYHVFFVLQCFSLFAQTGLHFLVLAEIILAQFVSELEQVIELFCIELVVLPQFCGALGGNGFDFLPFGLELLELVEVLVGVFGGGGHLLYAVQNLQLACQTFLLLLFDFFQFLGAAVADDLHQGTEFGFCGVQFGNELFAVSAFIHKLLPCLCHFGIVELVKALFQRFNLLLVNGVFAGNDFLGACQNFLFVLGSAYRCRCCSLFNGSCFGYNGLLRSLLYGSGSIRL